MPRIFTTLAFVCLTAAVFAQAPQKMSYQAVIRNASNALVANQPVGMRISILQGSASGTPVYVETQNPTTNSNGLSSLEIGSGTVVSGSFSAIDWANGPYFIKSETDPSGGSNYAITTTSQLLSVPYAMYARTAGNGVPSGSQPGEILTNCNGTLTWTVGGECPGSITALHCGSVQHIGLLAVGQEAIGVSSILSYSGGNGGVQARRAVNSTGVTGLVATLEDGYFARGNGKLVFTISGTPSDTGVANFALNIGGQQCTLSRNVQFSPYAPGTVFCNGIMTAVVNVTSSTGKIWMDRNLGASQAATSSTDANAYGDLYQWGRRADGHQCRNSPNTILLVSTDQPAHGDFILAPNSPYDWRSPQNNNLWQGVNGVNNPCPTGYRIPTSAELDAERISWSINSSTGAFASPLKMPLAGGRNLGDGSLGNVGSYGNYWSSAVNGTYAYFLDFGSGIANVSLNFRASGISVRCLKD